MKGQQTRESPAVGPAGHIQLDRRFQELTPGKEPEDLALDSYTRSLGSVPSGMAWNDLLNRRLVVVLGEPGSGKTSEFKNQVEQLRSKQHIAFYIPLDVLIAEPVHDVLVGDDLRQLKSWHDGLGTATFFLDSADEAKLLKSTDFHRALKNLSDSLGSARIERASFVLSSRISEWHPATDEHELRNRFQVPPTNRAPLGGTSKGDRRADNGNEILIVRMEPLDGQRVEWFAAGLGVKAVDRFMKALDDARAWEFARRPVDVVELVNYWVDNGRLGSLSELMEAAITRNLRSSPRDRQDPLSDGDARQGAEALGAALVLCRKLAFRVPDDALLVEDALDASLCLPEGWRREQCNALLARPIFDCASYGRIRFHHRRIAEYLAARWLERRMQEGCTTDLLQDLLTTYISGRRVCRPALASVAAWLCRGDAPWNDRVRQWVLETAPELHLLYGDPAGLPSEYKRRILKSLVERTRERRRVWMETSSDSLSRLADPALSSEVSSIVRNRSVSQDVRIEMLEMARCGGMTGCLDVALDIVACPDEVEEVKAYAAEVVRDIGDSSSRERLARTVAEMQAIPSQVCLAVCEALYPGTIGVGELTDIFRKTTPDAEHSFTLPYRLAAHLEAKLVPAQASELLSCILSLLEPPLPNAEAGVAPPGRKQLRWVGKLLPKTLKVLLKKPALQEAEAEAAGRAIWWLDSRGHDLGLEEDLAGLDKATSVHPRVRQSYFWRSVDEWCREYKRQPTSLYFLSAGKRILQPTDRDLCWLMTDVETRAEHGDRELALRFAMDLWARHGRGWSERRQIRNAIASDDALVRRFRELNAETRWAWIRRVWYQCLRPTVLSRFWWEKQSIELRRAWRWLRTEWVLVRHLKLLASGSRSDWLSYLSREVLQEGSSRWGTGVDWDALRHKRGRLVESAARAGCKRAWKQHVPRLPHERPDSSATDDRVVVGLIGLTAAKSDGHLDFAALSADEARVVARYAMNELNGFPWWLVELVQHHSDPVRTVLEECVEGEWRFAADRTQPYEVLHDLVWSDDQLALLVLRKILDLMGTGDPPNLQILRFALTILLRHSRTPRAELCEIAVRRVRDLPSEEPGSTMWLAVWLQLDADSALAELVRLLDTRTEAEGLMVQLCAILSGEHEQRPMAVPNPDYLRPSSLSTLIPLVYRYIPPGRDIARVGFRAYCPDARDHAQRFRDRLLGVLSAQDTTEALAVLRGLVEEPELANLRDWILHLADGMMERLADPPAWNPVDVRAFAKEYECDPRSDFDLFRIVSRRLEDIKHDVEKADTSIRQDLHPEDDEIRLRRWLANELTRRSCSRYTVPQEEEIDQRECPDLRVENPRISGPVSIEIKWADKWTMQQLHDGLEKQLVGQYLRDRNARYGVYFLGYIGRKGHWEHPADRHAMPFEEVLRSLTDQAALIMKQRPDLFVAVFGVDFRDPRSRG